MVTPSTRAEFEGFNPRNCNTKSILDVVFPIVAISIVYTTSVYLNIYIHSYKLKEIKNDNLYMEN